MVSPVTDRRLALAGNTGMKSPVTVVATTNVTQNGPQTIDGIAVVASNAAGVPDRVLCTAQTNAVNNGIWDVQNGDWTRADDADGTGDLARGTTVSVARGSAALQIWSLTTADPIVVDTTSQTWQQAFALGTATGSTSTTSGVAATIVTVSGNPCMLAVYAYLAAGGSAYVANARVAWDNTNLVRMGGEDGANLAISVSGANVRVTQTSGVGQTVFYRLLRVG